MFIYNNTTGLPAAQQNNGLSAVKKVTNKEENPASGRLEDIMRILIVDDEKLTRDGLLSSIDWKALSFDSVDQADDGVNALKIAKSHPPDILLTDVRMPRMNGIQLVEKIQELNPNCAVIFMSGYSDKEYLMAAIKLRAVRYVEKPIFNEEILEAITHSMNEILQNRAQLKSKALLKKEAISKYALKLTHSGYDFKKDHAIEEASLRESIHASTIFTTFIIKINQQWNNPLEDNFTTYIETFDELIGKWNLAEIHFIKNDNFLVLHLYGNDRPGEELLIKIGNHLKSILPGDLEYFVAVGKTVTGPGKVFESYNSAVILLQSAFFFEYGSLLLDKLNADSLPGSCLHEFSEGFSAAIRDKDVKEAKRLAETFYQTLKYNRSFLANVIKDLYYKLFLEINYAQYDLKLQTENSPSDPESLLDRISNCRILKELHELLLDKIDEFAQKLQTKPEENITIFLIRDYISKHYGDYSLSIKDISNHVHLSSSYLCTVFKTETGETLNQYITDYRIEKAKQLLSDPRSKVTEISNRVGYSDLNYFGKLFKKVVGVTPSEYREKELS